MINVGEMFYFKTGKGRGRPYVGEVVKKMGIFTLMRTKKGEELRIQTKFLGNPYAFKPYQTKKRKEEL